MALPQTIPFLDWAWDDLLFLLLSGIMLGAALFVVIGRDIVRSGLSMILAFAALAGIYVLAGAIVVAAAQVLIYIGAISVLILFAIMLTQSKAGPASLVFHRQAWAGALAAVGVGLLLIVSVINTEWPLRVFERLLSPTAEVALLLFSDTLYVLALQVVGVLLTAAVIGGVFLARRDETPDPGEPQAATLDRLRRPPPPIEPTYSPEPSYTASPGDAPFEAGFAAGARLGQNPAVTTPAEPLRAVAAADFAGAATSRQDSASITLREGPEAPPDAQLRPSVAPTAKREPQLP